MGLEFWNDRYSSQNRASWPDDGARLLELDFITRNVPVDPGSVLEVGCGALTLLESPLLRAWIAGTRYAGVDGSPEALRLAESRAHAAGLDVQLYEQNFEGHRELRPCDFVLCRRTLVNLSREARRDLLWQFAERPHGLLIEPTKEGLAQLNLARLDNHLPPIPEAEHNDYLTKDEVEFFTNRRMVYVIKNDHLGGIRESRFMSSYYERTRAKEELGKIDQQWRYEQAMASRQEAPGLLGPVVGFTW